MKKTKNSRKVKSKNTANLKRAENNILLVNCGLIVYALVLALIHRMSQTSQTIDGAYCILYFFQYAGIAAAMGIAAYAAYVSKKSLLKYAFMCVFIAISSAVITGPSLKNNTDENYMIVAIAIAVAFILNLVYAFITDRALYYENKRNRIIYRTSVGIIYGIIMIFLIVRYIICVTTM